MIWTWWKILGVIVGVLWITAGVLYAIGRGILRALGRVFWPWFVFLACSGDPGTVPEPPPRDAGAEVCDLDACFHRCMPHSSEEAWHCYTACIEDAGC